MSTIYWQVGVMVSVMLGVAVALIKLFEWAFSHSQSPPASGRAKR